MRNSNFHFHRFVQRFLTMHLHHALIHNLPGTHKTNELVEDFSPVCGPRSDREAFQDEHAAAVYHSAQLEFLP